MSAGKAPIRIDALALCQWILGRFHEDARELPRALCREALTLTRSIVLALKGRAREHRLEHADEALVTLRLYLRIAEDTGLLTDEQVVHAFELADRVGRQLGGWMRSLGAL
jgi:hypothetical protein